MTAIMIVARLAEKVRVDKDVGKTSPGESSNVVSELP